jgi:hypothetical protein
MTDSDLHHLRGYFHTGEIPVATPHCLDAETVAALAEGTLDAEAGARALKHLATCVHCRGAVASVAAALADGPITHEIEVVEGRRRRGGPVLRVAVPLAAAATLLLLLWSPTNDAPGTHRGGGTQGRDVVPVPVGPIGAVANVRSLDWTRVVGSDRYRVTLFDAQGEVLYETEVNDTTAALPDSVRLIPERPYLWKVQARTGWDRWSASDLVEFTIARGPPQ